MESTAQTGYTVSARKYRPQHWDAVVGQDGITRTLKQAIEQEQVAQAYLFCGPRGVGKTTSARIFARAINGFEVSEISDYAFNVFELDAASNNKVEDIRSIVDQVRIPPQQGKYKVYIIDEVHMLSQAAFNAFLKTLEEPPPHAVFILATTEKHKILPTILSRCQIFDFHRITVPDMVTHLQGICEKEGIQAEESALHVVAVKADGALRDALSIFDQLVAFAGKKLDYATVAEHLHVLDQQTYFDVVDAVREGEVARALLMLDGIIARGFDPHHFITGLGAHLRNLMVSKDATTIQLMEVTDDVKAQFAQQSAAVDLRFLVRALDQVNQADVQYKSSNHQRLLVELTLMQIASMNEAEKKKPELIGIVQDAWSAEARVPEAGQAKVEPRPASLPVDPTKLEKTDESVADSEPKVLAELEVVEAPAPPEKTSDHGKPATQEKPVRRGKVRLAAPDTLLDSSVSKAPPKFASPLRTEPVTQEKLESAWAAFLEATKSNDQLNFYTTLRASSVMSEGSQLIVTVLNKLQESQIRESQLDMMRFMADALNNDELKLEIQLKPLDESTAASTEFMNDRERYDAMVSKNPNLDELRKRLDLDLLG
jgi:DNA polymerase-3 subunit gamma/tau